MITTILQKCLDELAKEKPDLRYIKGMIEVLLASQPQIAKYVILRQRNSSIKYAGRWSIHP